MEAALEGEEQQRFGGRKGTEAKKTRGEKDGGIEEGINRRNKA